uniref:Probable thiol oxidoreductase with 2 cytochrome c heme-binding sites n=1 Tax=uncultured Thiotrichaceae bacterium TaxID=298394 RepID=A0A6S6UC05_9GAMM|nr:MAG: Probable thiol oxidoreductase with 2 cytochrome c heme-binding sites [uncultured Thiotrichaceae bacterium]
MKKHRVATVLSFALIPGLTSGVDGATDQSQHSAALSGGATTVFERRRNAFLLPADNLSIERQDDFFVGRAFFRLPWVTAPALTKARDGLGPLFNGKTCLSCHVRNGRGHAPINKDEPFQSALIRLSIPPTTQQQRDIAQRLGAVPERGYGDQLQFHAIPGIKPETSAQIAYTEISGQFNDGESYTLLKPQLTLEQGAYGEFDAGLMTSVRVAPLMVGLGLLEAIPEADILELADPDDDDNDGVSGRPNQVWDIARQAVVLGRFGLKANQPTVEQQSAAAFSADLGITSTLFPEQSCTEKQEGCSQARHGGEPEISAELMEKVTFYVSVLGVPARRNAGQDMVLLGEQLFRESGCMACHVGEYRTGESKKYPELSHQIIRPYTDLLLHDMGEGLADGRPDFKASGREWRTPPLWGIGLVEKVNGHSRFLHDGRARNLLEAVLWHGGEGESAKRKVLALTKRERHALVAFLNSL